MNPRVGLVTYAAMPNLCDDDAPLVDYLQRRNAEPIPVIWNDPNICWETFDALLVRSPWDYPANLQAFLEWHRKVEAITPTANSAAMSHSSASKQYLWELGNQGAPVLPTIPVDSSHNLAQMAHEQGWREVVLKPAVGLGNNNVALIRDTTQIPNLIPHGETYCLQPYYASIESFGELSIICIEGSVSHVVLKRPGSNDFRVHEKFGGSHVLYARTQEIEEFANTMMHVTASQTELAVRFDAVRGPDGQLRLLEMDLFGPCLYFCHSPTAADLLARGILSKIKR